MAGTSLKMLLISPSFICVEPIQIQHFVAVSPCTSTFGSITHKQATSLAFVEGSLVDNVMVSTIFVKPKA